MPVSAIKTENYQPDTLHKAIKQHFEEHKIGELLTKDTKVLLKPNLLLKAKPEAATTTHPAVMKAVVEVVASYGVSDITIADSPGGPYTRAVIEGVYNGTGMTQVCRESIAKLNMDFSYKNIAAVVENPLCRSFNIITPIVEADVIINLPKLKTHAMTTMSGAVKNLLGCVPGLQKPELHFQFPQKDDFGRMLVELSQIVKPHFTIVDAVVSMEGNGPSSGSLKETGFTFASRDIYELDAALAAFTMLPTEEIPTIKASRVLGLLKDSAPVYFGQPPTPSRFILPDSKSINMSGSVPKPLRGIMEWFLNRYLAPKPIINIPKCIGCGKCAESCPPHVIEITAGKAVIDYKGCIKCFCCHEMCPAKAIDIKRSSILKF